jgi:hypothetical protein
MVAAAVPGTVGALQSATDSVATASAPLFATQEPLRMVLRAPFDDLFRDRSDEAPELPATLTYLSDAGDSVHMDLDVELRGNTRRQRSTCSFPPIRLDFPRTRVGETVFAGQNRLKLVTQCREGREEFGQYVLLEYLTYRAFNQLTDLSFRARLLEVTYEDTQGKMDRITRPAFLIEDEDAVAIRNGWELLELQQAPPEYMDQVQLNLVEVLQYMIGHTDWSAFQAEPDEDECCHNVKIIGSMHGPIFPIPYDFDYAGLIDARYAEVNERLGVRDVRDRLYRGLCRPREDLDATLQRFNVQQAAIIQVFQEHPGLTDDSREKAIEYLDEFYEIINNPGRVEREFVRSCRD